MNKKLFVIVTLALLALVSLGTAVAQDVTSLTVWIPPVFSEAHQQQFEDYTAETGIEFEIEVFPVPFEQNLLAKWAAGDRPDLLFFHAIGNWIVQLNPAENLQPLTDEPFVERTIPGILDKSSTYQGEIYAAILDYPFLDGVFYNKPVFEELGLEIPGGYDDLVALCQTIQEQAPDIAPIFTGGGDQWPLQVLPFMLWNDDIIEQDLIAQVNTNEAQFTHEAFVSAVAKQKELQDMGCFNDDLLTATYADEQEAIMTGQAAMVFQGTWLVGSLVDSYGVEEVNEQVGFFGLSTRSNVVSWQTVGAGAVYAPITGDAAREEAARAFIDWATGEGYEQFLINSKQFPILVGYDTPPDVPQVLIEANEAFLAEGAPQYQQTLLATYGAFETYLSEMVSGQITPEEVMQRMDTEFQRSARLLGLPGF